MKILFVMLHAGFVRNYEPVLRLLASKGHHIHVSYELDRNKLGENVQIERLAQEITAITFSVAPESERALFANFVRVTRVLQDYLRYLEPDYAGASSLRQRVEENIPRGFRRLVLLLGGTAVARRVMMAALRSVEAVVPPPDSIRDFVAAHAPDVLLVTPLVDFGSNQVDYIKAAEAAGIPNALCVASWDNLTNKGLMRTLPDRVLVWNEAQKAEAVHLHGVPAERVVVTGAQLFDHWFDWKPSRSREDFCARVGIDPAKPFVLFLGSSNFIAPEEALVAERWMRAIRSAPDPVLADAGILVRPHPTNLSQWLAFEFSRLDNTALWPRAEVSPFTDEFKSDFYDSMYYSAVICGVNTSAQIEAGIVGRAVCSYLAPEFAHSQRGTLHFHHLTNVNGGLVQVAEDLDEHLEDLARAIHEGDASIARSHRFVEGFVRPHGLGVPATPIVAGAILALSELSRAPKAMPGWTAAARVALAPAAWWVGYLWRPRRKLKLNRVPPLWWYPFRPLVFLSVMSLMMWVALRELWRAVDEVIRRARKVVPRQWRALQSATTRRLRQVEIHKLATRGRRRVEKAWRVTWKTTLRTGARGVHRCRLVVRTLLGSGTAGR